VNSVFQDDLAGESLIEKNSKLSPGNLRNGADLNVLSGTFSMDIPVIKSVRSSPRNR
jgi:hypothetical protein